MTNLGVHDVLHVSDIPVSCRHRNSRRSPDTVIATVGVVKEEVVEVAPVEGEAPAEPEVIGKGKKEDEGEGEAPKRSEEGIADCRFAIADCQLVSLAKTSD